RFTIRIFHLERAAAGTRRVAGHRAVRHRAFGQVPRLVAFTRAAHCFREDMDLGALPTAGGIFHGGRADERVLADIPHGLRLEPIDAGAIGDVDGHDAVRFGCD